MMTSTDNSPHGPSVTADAVALQERDEFQSAGWLKVIAPAKVNLHLAIGARRGDGYHEAVSIMHAINLHDVVYARRRALGGGGNGSPAAAVSVHMVACGDVKAPAVAPEDNIATRAVVRLAERVGREPDLELRIEKNIPAEGGLGGGSTDAAAALVAAAALWGLADGDPAVEQTARELGADVAFFLHGGCACLTGAGDEFSHALEPMKRSVALVKPACGVSTAAAYRAFDEAPSLVPPGIAANAMEAQWAEDVALFNNLASASERLAPELAEVKAWLEAQPGVEGALLCGSGATSFAVCSDFPSACAVVAGARQRGWWARTTSFGSVRAMAVPGEPAGRQAAATPSGGRGDAAVLPGSSPDPGQMR